MASMIISENSYTFLKAQPSGFYKTDCFLRVSFIYAKEEGMYGFLDAVEVHAKIQSDHEALHDTKFRWTKVWSQERTQYLSNHPFLRVMLGMEENARGRLEPMDAHFLEEYLKDMVSMGYAEKKVRRKRKNL